MLFGDDIIFLDRNGQIIGGVDKFNIVVDKGTNTSFVHFCKNRNVLCQILDIKKAHATLVYLDYVDSGSRHKDIYEALECIDKMTKNAINGVVQAISEMKNYRNYSVIEDA